MPVEHHGASHRRYRKTCRKRVLGKPESSPGTRQDQVRSLANLHVGVAGDYPRWLWDPFSMLDVCSGGNFGLTVTELSPRFGNSSKVEIDKLELRSFARDVS